MKRFVTGIMVAIMLFSGVFIFSACEEEYDNYAAAVVIYLNRKVLMKIPASELEDGLCEREITLEFSEAEFGSFNFELLNKEGIYTEWIGLDNGTPKLISLVDTYYYNKYETIISIKTRGQYVYEIMWEINNAFHFKDLLYLNVYINVI